MHTLAHERCIRRPCRCREHLRILMNERKILPPKITDNLSKAVSEWIAKEFGFPRLCIAICSGLEANTHHCQLPVHMKLTSEHIILGWELENTNEKMVFFQVGLNWVWNYICITDSYSSEHTADWMQLYLFLCNSSHWDGEMASG